MQDPAGWSFFAAVFVIFFAGFLTAQCFMAAGDSIASAGALKQFIECHCSPWRYLNGTLSAASNCGELSAVTLGYS